MTVGLSPALALDFITALSADIRAAVVLDAAGAHLAGPRALADAASALPDVSQAVGAVAGGAVYAARDERHVIVVVTGPLALDRLTRHDLRTALSALGGQTAPIDPPQRVPDALVHTLLRAL